MVIFNFSHFQKYLRLDVIFAYIFQVAEIHSLETEEFF